MADIYNDFNSVQDAIRSGSSDVSSSLNTYQRYAKEIARTHPELAYELSRLGEYGSVQQIRSAWKSLADRIPDNTDLAKHESEILNGLLLAREMEHVQAVDQNALQTAPPRGTGVGRATHRAGDVLGDAIAAPVNLLKRNKFMEEDSEFQTIEDNLKNEWYKKREDWIKNFEQTNGGPKESDFNNKKAYQKAVRDYRKKNWEEIETALQGSSFSKEAELNYIHGSLDSPILGPDGNPLIQLTLEHDARAQFAKTLEGRRFLAWNTGKRKLERYNRNQLNLEQKIYKNPGSDPHVAALKQKIADHQRARLLLEYERIRNSIQDKKRRAAFTFEKFLYSKDHAETIANIRHKIAQAEWNKWEYSKVDPKKKISQKKLDAYKQYKETHLKSFEYRIENHRRPFSFFQRFRMPITTAGIATTEITEETSQEQAAPAQEAEQERQDSRQQQRQYKKQNTLLRKLKRKALKKLGEKLGNKFLENVAEKGLWTAFRMAIWPIISGIIGTIGWAPIITIGGFVAVVVFFIILFWLLANLLGGAPAPIQLTCGSSELNAVYGTTKNVYDNFLEVNYAIGGDDTSYGKESKITRNMALAIYSDICMTFGRVEKPGQTQGSGGTGKIVLNSFGDLTVGNCKQRGCDPNTGQNPTGSTGSGYRDCNNRNDDHACQVMFSLSPGPNPYIPGDTGSTCTISPDKTQPNGNLIIWRLFNADKCLVNDSSGHIFASPRLEFLLSQSLAYTLLIQQHVLGGPDLTKDPDFVNALIEKGQWNPLPTFTCLSHFNSQNPPQAIKDFLNIGKDCFADSVGSYITYPYFIYGSGGIPIPTPTVYPTINPTISSIIPKLTVTLPAIPTGGGGGVQPENLTPILSPLSDFPTGNYKKYYEFAFAKLFNQLDFYFNSGTGKTLQVAATIDRRLDSGGGSNWDQFTPGPRGKGNQDWVTPQMIIQPIVGNFKDTDPGSHMYNKTYTVSRRGTPGATDNDNKLRYWCTDFVIDAFNLTYGKRLLSENLGLVSDMAIYFLSKSATDKTYVFIPNDGKQVNMAQVQGGDIIFFAHTLYLPITVHNIDHLNWYHVGIVQGVYHNKASPQPGLDSHGNGWIDTMEANAFGPTGNSPYTVSNWKALDDVAAFATYVGN